MRSRVSAGILAALLGLLCAPVAATTISGPCTATIAGQNVANRGTSATSDAIAVSKGDSVVVSMSSSKPIDHLKVQLEFAGIRWTVHDRPTSGTSWSSVVKVDDYATYGVGLYKVIGSSSGAGFSCTGAALVDVGGSGFSSVAGLVGLGLAVLAGIGLGLVAARGRGSVGAMIAGALLGLLLGLGLGVVLQQFSVLYPTLAVAIVLLVGGAVLGVVLGGMGRVLGRAHY